MNYLGSAFKYAKSYIVTPTFYPQWMSFILFFKDSENNIILDKAYLFTGNIPKNYFSHYINFPNWKITNEKLVYIKDGEKIKVDPKKVFLYFKLGSEDYNVDLVKENIAYWYNFVSSPSNKLFQQISPQFNKTNLKIINIEKKKRQKNYIKNIFDIIDPKFHSVKYFGKNYTQGCFSNLNIEFL